MEVPDRYTVLVPRQLQLSPLRRLRHGKTKSCIPMIPMCVAPHDHTQKTTGTRLLKLKASALPPGGYRSFMDGFEILREMQQFEF